jgi:hypothetical protein
LIRRRVNYTTRDLSITPLANIILDPQLRKTQRLTVPHSERKFFMMAVQPILLPAELLTRLVNI